MRKIIQISESFVDGSSVGDYFNISALCDDGSLWYLNDFKKGWERYPDIPQDEDKEISEILSKPIRFLDLTVKTLNILENSGIHHIGDLIKLSAVELLKIPLLGRKAYMQIKAALAMHGLELSEHQCKPVTN